MTSLIHSSRICQFNWRV